MQRAQQLDLISDNDTTGIGRSDHIRGGLGRLGGRRQLGQRQPPDCPSATAVSQATGVAYAVDTSVGTDNCGYTQSADPRAAAISGGWPGRRRPSAG